MNAPALTYSCLALALTVGFATPAASQTGWDPNTVRYEGPSAWQQAAVVTLNRHLPTDSGYWVLGPIDLRADLSDTTDLVGSTLRILTPGPRASRNIARRLWFPTGGVALEELQPSDTLPHELPPGYPGRFLEGTIVGERVYVQVFTIQEHRWLLWARRAQIEDIKEQVVGPLASYSEAVARYLAAIDSGQSATPPAPSRYGVDPIFDLFDPPPEPVVGTRDGYLDLLARHRSFTLEDAVRDVEGFVPGERLMDWLEEQAEDVLFRDKNGERALQQRFRDYRETQGDWIGYPVLSAGSFTRLAAGRYLYTADRYGIIRLGRAPPEGGVASGQGLSTALLAMGEPVLAAGELRIEREADGSFRVAELNIRSGDYFFSNRSLTIYPDVEQRSDRYVRALGHVLRGLEIARIPRDGILIRKL